MRPRSLVASTWCAPAWEPQPPKPPHSPPLCRPCPGPASGEQPQGYIGPGGRWRPDVAAAGQHGDAAHEAGGGKVAAGATASGTRFRGRSRLKTPNPPPRVARTPACTVSVPRGRLPGTWDVRRRNPPGLWDTEQMRTFLLSSRISQGPCAWAPEVKTAPLHTFNPNSLTLELKTAATQIVPHCPS